MQTPTTAIILKALDGLSARAEAIAENIANAGTPGYRPLRVSFEAALAQAVTEGKAAVDGVEPRLERTSGSGSGTGLRLDMELAAASSTATRYAALIEVLNRQSQRDAVAVSGSGSGGF